MSVFITDYLHSVPPPLMFALEICNVQFSMKTLRFLYDVRNVKVQRHKRKSEIMLVPVKVALPLI